jgi:hypothetical protein
LFSSTLDNVHESTMKNEDNGLVLWYQTIQ